MWVPDIDLHELPDGYLILIDLPGVARDELHLDVAPGSIVVSGNTTDDLPAGIVASLRERARGPFRRRLDLPTAIDVPRVQASIRDGLLRIVAPKLREASA
jgi:HSP20 family protein